MKIFFVEGPDNTGKSTVVNELFNWLCTNAYANINIMHCEKPVGNTIEEQIEYQNNAYEELARQLVEWNKSKEYDAVIFDRCWYGEYVYGTLYRNRDSKDVMNRINHYEEILLQSIKPQDLHLILLTTNLPEFLVKNDDGKSISNADLELIKKELKLFDEVYEQSYIGKDLIKTTIEKYDHTVTVQRKVKVIVTKEDFVEVDNIEDANVLVKNGAACVKKELCEFKSRGTIFGEIYEKLGLNIRLF